MRKNDRDYIKIKKNWIIGRVLESFSVLEFFALRESDKFEYWA